MNTLLHERCIPCEGDVLPLSGTESEPLLKELGDSWKIKEGKLLCEFRFKDFAEAIQFVNQVASVAEKESHHPDIHVSFNKVRLELFTHSIKGLSKNDFILAAKIDALAQK